MHAIALVLLPCVLALASVASGATPVVPDTAEPSPAHRWYVGLEAGLGVFNGFDPSIPFVGDTGFEVGGAAALRAGLQWRDHVRFETEVAWNGSSIDSLQGRIDVLASTLNAYYDLGEREAFVRPYVGAGLGVAGGWLESDRPVALATGLGDRSGVGMAYVVEGGGRFRLTDRLCLSAAWHFLGTVALIDDGTGGSISPTMHGFMLGLHSAF